MSLCRYLPRSTPSMSDTATLTRVPGRIARRRRSTLAAEMAAWASSGLLVGSDLWRGRGRATRVVLRTGDSAQAGRCADGWPNRADHAHPFADPRPMNRTARAARPARGRAAVRLRGPVRQVAGTVAGADRARRARRWPPRALASLRMALRGDGCRRSSGAWSPTAPCSRCTGCASSRRSRSPSVAIGLLGFASFPLFVLLLERAAARPRAGAGREGATAGLVVAGLRAAGSRVLVRQPDGAGSCCGARLSGFTFALLAVLNRRLVARPAGRPTSRSGRTLFAALALLPVVVLAGVGAARALGAREIALLLVLGRRRARRSRTRCSSPALRGVTAHTASVVAALEPVYGIALALPAAGRGPGHATLLGGALIVGAALVATVAQRSADPWRTRIGSTGRASAVRAEACAPP